MDILSFLKPKFVEEVDEKGCLIGRGELRGGQKIGIWQEFNPQTRRVTAEGVYRNAKKYGTWFYYDALTSRPVAFGAYFKGEPVGTWHVANVARKVYEEIRYQPLIAFSFASGSRYFSLYDLKVYKTMPLSFNNQVYASYEGRAYGHFCPSENFVPDGDSETFYENGRTENIVSFHKGKREGEYRVYYMSGRLKTKGFYRAGKQHGEWITYDSNGEIASVASYDRGSELHQEIFKDVTIQNPYAVPASRRVTSYRPWQKKSFVSKEKTHD